MNVGELPAKSTPLIFFFFFFLMEALSFFKLLLYSWTDIYMQADTCS